MQRSEERSKALGYGALVIVVTTTVPLLTIVNMFFFAGILSAGALSAYYYIITCQQKLSLPEAFTFSGYAGVLGSILSVTAGYILITVFDYRPGTEEFLYISDQLKGVSPEQDTRISQFQEMLRAPLEMSFVDYLLSLVITIVIYAPVAGLGGVIVVWILKRQAARA
ncbi:MAG: hypothetical protein ISR54_00925 [Chlorobium phaeobacteroides]|uniref:DUF4199 domain-containing protein n=1 Tax=Chlorobium phaeobacteroides (strain BS1) TaxID=331678 RepID=B3EN03_CHLPB|nr:hypothetical protein [Chlorobium phaeobacteroides]MBL6955376.1 hypothetical protein [Chlorobium phaeobacteroides]